MLPPGHGTKDRNAKKTMFSFGCSPMFTGCSAILRSGETRDVMQLRPESIRKEQKGTQPFVNENVPVCSLVMFLPFRAPVARLSRVHFRPARNGKNITR